MFDKEKVARLQPQSGLTPLPPFTSLPSLCRLEAIHLQLRRFVSFWTRIECAPSWMELAWMAIHPSVQPTACKSHLVEQGAGSMEGVGSWVRFVLGEGEGCRDQHRKASGNYAYLLLSRPPSPGQAIDTHTHKHTLPQTSCSTLSGCYFPPTPSNHPLDYPKLDANHIRPHRSSLPLCM